MRRLAAILWAGILVVAASGQVIYHNNPDWVSATSPYSTGAALVDLNRDGYLDLVVSNGNDITPGPIYVYYNRGDGTFPANPDWQSADNAFHGHLDVADINGDGWPDIAVSLLLNEGGPAAKVYMNHNGTLSSLPEWTSTEIAPSFGVAFGDMNGDGRPDLAVATGNSYYSQRYHSTVHLNIDGQLEPNASWLNQDTSCYMGALWTDADNDGWLDFIGVGGSGYNRAYRNLGGLLDPNASWANTDANQAFGIMATAGDVAGAGRRALFVTDNTQMGSTGLFRQYNGVAGGMFNTAPDWTYGGRQYGSAVALADVNADGRLDLAIGGWWDWTGIFINNGSGFGAAPTWTSTRTSVVEKIVFGDLANRALRHMTESFAGATGHLFYLAHQPIQSVVAVRRNGVELLPSQFTFSREHGWVSIGPAVGDVEIDYTYSLRLDMVVANWDPQDGNFIYYNQLPPPGDMNCDGVVNFADISPFVLALSDPAGYAQQYPNCRLLNADCNGDGLVNFDDINPFVAVLTH